jgi:hypothetical protein
MNMMKRWFGMSAPVSPRFYLLSGLGLMLVRCIGDSTVLFAMAGTRAFEFWNPAIYISPFLTHRAELLKEMMGGSDAAQIAVGVLALWALPFAWIGVSMSMRRARDGGQSLWLGLLFLIPVVNLLLIAALCVLPSRPAASPAPAETSSESTGMLKSALIAIAWAAGFGLLVALASIFLLGNYGSALFVAGPVVMGAIGGWQVNRPRYRGYKAGLLVGTLSAVLCFSLLILLALEGLICLLMVAPLGLGLTLMGAVIGTGLAKAGSTRAPVGALANALPIIGLTETAAPPPLEVYAVVSEIQIDAPPEAVWPNVIGFSELPPPSDWVLKTGISTPLRARIDGEGVDAVRYCEFTTGPFVEPITVWEPPTRLAFDVSSQPDPMQEWSPWEEVYAPHLEDTMLSQRGEFSLERTESGGTLLRGTTWYTLDLSPSIYWRVWSDFVVHRIHVRVLDHIKDLSEPA